LKLNKLEDDAYVMGTVVYRKDPDVEDLHTVKMSSDHQRIYFVFKHETYLLELDDLIDEVKKQKKVSKKKMK